MKKLFYILNAVLAVGILTCIVCQKVFDQNFIGIICQVLIVILAGFNFSSVFIFKNKKKILSAILILLGIVLAIICNAFIVKDVVTFYILLSLAELAFLFALVFNTRFVYSDIFYMVAIAVPMILFVNLAPIFGFSGVNNRLLVSLVTIVASCLLGLSISCVVKKCSIFNICYLIISLFNLIYLFGVIVSKQCNVTHRIVPLVTIGFYSLLLLFSLVTIFFIKLPNEKCVKTSLKKNIFNAVNLCLTTMIIGYTIVSNLLALNFVSAKIYKNQFLSMVNNDLDIPIVEIYTQDNELPKNKEDYVNCSFKISNCENEDDNFSVSMKANYEDEGCVGIRLRGNSTMGTKKKPYRIKFDEKQSFFDLKANKSWVLLADYYDQSYIRNYTAFTLAGLIEQTDIPEERDFVPTPHHVALIINNEFKGLYLLCEQMDEKKGRANVDEDFDVSVDKEFPFLVEMDANASREGVTGIDNFDVKGACPVEIKYPESDERSRTETCDVVYDYIYEYINAVFKTIQTNEKVEVSFRDEPVGFEDLVDVDSAVDYYLVNEIMLNADSVWKSIYLHKSKDGKLKFGPIWDFDYSMTTTFDLPYDKSYIEEANNMYVARGSVAFKHLMKNEEFYNKVVARYNVINSKILETCEILKEYKSVIEEVADIDSKMWHGSTGEFQFDMQYDYVRLFLNDRYAYLNDTFSKSHSEFLSLI